MEERALWIGVLVRALFDLAGIDGVCERAKIALLQSSALAWIESTRSDLGSFRWICNSLNLEPSAVRRAIFKEAEHMVDAKRRRGSPHEADNQKLRSNPPQTESLQLSPVQSAARL